MFTCVWMLAFLIHERSMCEGPLPCKHYLISVMQRGPWPPRCVPSLWELKSTWLAGTKSRPPLPPAPAPAAPAHLPTKGATGPKFPGNDINGAPPQLLRMRQGAEKPYGLWEKNGKEVIKEMPLHHLLLFQEVLLLGLGGQGGIEVTGAKGWGWEETKDRSERVAGVKTPSHSLHTSTESPYQIDIPLHTNTQKIPTAVSTSNLGGKQMKLCSMRTKPKGEMIIKM